MDSTQTAKIIKTKNKFPVFSKRFSELRGQMTQGDFAKFLDISRPTVGFYENGERIPDALILKRIAEKCDVSTDWLLGLSLIKNNEISQMAEATGFCKSLIEEAVSFYLACKQVAIVQGKNAEIKAKNGKMEILELKKNLISWANGIGH